MPVIGVVVLVAGLVMIYMGFTGESLGELMKTVFANG